MKAALVTAGIAGIGLAAGVVVKQLYDLGAEWDSIADSITVRTGKVGSDLQNLTNVVGDVGRTTAASLGSIGEVVSQISQSMPDLAQNNAAVRQMASNLAYLDANGQAVNIRELGKAFSAFNVDANDQVRTLDQLNQVSQATGIPINQLIATVQSGAPQFKQFGLNIGEATGLLAAFEEGGLQGSQVTTGLRIALSNLGDDARGAGPALAEAVTQIKALHDVGQEGAASDLAAKVFGTENFGPFLDAIESGRVNVQGLAKDFGDVKQSIAEQQRATDDGAQSWDKLVNTLKSEFKPAADAIFGGANSLIMHMTGHLTEAKNELHDLANTPIDPNSALGKILTSGGVAIPGTSTGAGRPAPTGIGSGFGTPAVPGATSSLMPYSWGSNLLSPPAAARGRTGLPQAPSLPYDSTLPAGFANLPQTAELVGAENSWMDARHSLAEKQARVNQLERDNNATADDKVKAQNDVVQAQQALDQSVLRLYDTQKQRTQQHADDMNQLGAKIDSDFGISKGLGGIMENLAKFLGNLIAMPALTQLDAITKAPGQAQGGYGLMGILGAQGVFGPQYTAAGQAAAANGGASGLGPAVLQPGGAVSYSGAGVAGLPAPVANAHGSHPQIAQIAAIAQSFGLQFTAGKNDHADDGGYHPAGMAGDFSNSSGNSAQELAFANYMAQNFGPMLQELIYSDPNFSNLIGGGKNVTGTGYYSPGVLGEHTNHVHVAMTDQAAASLSGMSTYAPSSGVPTGPTGPIAAFGAPGSKQAIANMIYQQALSRGYSPHEAQSILAYAIGESGLNAGSSGGVQGGGGDAFADTVQGLFQQKPAFAQGGGISPGQRTDPVANTTAYLNQLEKHRNLPIEQALPATSVGGPLAPGGYQPWGPLMTQAQNYIGAGSSGPAGLGGFDPNSRRGTGDAGAHAGEGAWANPNLGGGNFNPTIQIDLGNAGIATPSIFGTTGGGRYQGGQVQTGGPYLGFPEGDSVSVDGIGGGASVPWLDTGPGYKYRGVGSAGEGFGAPAGLGFVGAPQGVGWGTNPAGPGVGGSATSGLGPRGPMVGGAAGGPGANTTQIGGVGGLQGSGKGGGPGIESGGLLDTAIGAGAMALDVMAPGAGQAAQIGIKLANRAIQFGGQAAGILTQGALDTFIPFGGSKLAQSNWLTKIVGGIAGAAPALPNMAGKAAGPTPQSVANADPNAAQGQGQGGQGGGGNTYNANITNNQPRDEGGSGRDALHVWQNQGPGM